MESELALLSPPYTCLYIYALSEGLCSESINWIKLRFASV